jgi:hypothetical protein
VDSTASRLSLFTSCLEEVFSETGTVEYLYSGGTNFTDRLQEESLLYILDKVGSDGEYSEVNLISRFPLKRLKTKLCAQTDHL